MLLVFIKATILFFSVFFVMRVMGKRQLGEMQPVELVITLILAEIALIPMNDPYIPMYYGLVPIITLGTLHLVISFIAKKSMKVRHLLSGKSVIVVDKNGICYDNLKKMNINVNDLLESVRTSGYADFNTIQYAIIETNGKLCVIEKESDPTKPTPPLLPITLFVDGAWNDKNLELTGLSQQSIKNIFAEFGFSNPKDILYADIRQDGVIYVSPKKGRYFTDTVSLATEGSW